MVVSTKQRLCISVLMVRTERTLIRVACIPRNLPTISLQHCNIAPDRTRLNIGFPVDAGKAEEQACLQALFQTLRVDPRDDRNNLIARKGSKTNGTCEWIRSNEIYKSWLQSRSQLLWLSGGPGKGKTMLSIFLTEELERITKDSQDAVLLEYFCDNKDDRRNTADGIIRGLLYQLLILRPNLFHHILPVFKIQKESLFTASSFESLWRIFESSVCDPLVGNIYCVVDGLDECDGTSLEVLLKRLKALFSIKSSDSSSCCLKIIAVSRAVPDFIPEILSSFPCLRLDPDADCEVNQDIHRFVDVEVNNLSSYRQYPEWLCLHVKRVFRERAQGTFLWVGIVAKTLRKYRPTEVERALELFPSGLEELYARMLLQIDPEQREIAAKILLWVVMAVRPLTLSEMSAAIELGVEPSSNFTRDDVMREKLSYCGYFLTIREREISLIHQSPKEYLLRGSQDSNPVLELLRIPEKTGNLEIARKCFEYLQNGALAEGPVDLGERKPSRLDSFPLLSYAVLYWPEHAKSLSGSNSMFDLSQPFYNENSHVRDSWLWTVRSQYRGQTSPRDDSPEIRKLLHWASWLGILPLAENLLRQSRFVDRLKGVFFLDTRRDSRDNENRTALHWAAIRGQLAMVRLLLEFRVDVDAMDDFGYTALDVAVTRGYGAVVRLLLKNGAKVGGASRRVRYSGWIPTRVTVAVLKGGMSIAFVSRRGRLSETALFVAAKSGHTDMVDRLLQEGANIEAKTRSGQTALRVAAANDHTAIAQLLLKNGADIEAKTKSGQTALHVAAANGHTAIIRLLLDRGANINTKDSSGDTALHSATLHRTDAMVRLLLEKGADVKAKSDSGLTALHIAAQCVYRNTIRLLEKVADVNARDGSGKTALHLAAHAGSNDTVRALLEKGADINARDDAGETVLDIADRRRYKATVQLLTPLTPTS